MSKPRQSPNTWKSRLEKILPLVFFLFVFFLYFSLLGEPTFTDEQDILFGGYNIIKGKDIYASFLSQHMPVSYYMAAPIALLGARTVFQFRLGIYLLMSLLWELIYLRHRKAHSPLVLFLTPLLYLAILKNYNLGTTMLSDHWQGIGLLMILLELIRYSQSRQITLPCAGMISLGILLSFGTVFISAYSVCCYFLAAAALQISYLRLAGKGDPMGKDTLRREVRGQDLRLLAICLLPFLVLWGWYAVSGNLENFYSGAYEIVTRVYSKYTGGLGSNPVSVVWDTPGAYALYLWSAVQGLGSAFGPSLLVLAEAFALICFCVLEGRKSPAVGIAAFLAAVYSGIRGFDSFHTMAYHAHAACALAFVIQWLLEKTETQRIPRLLSRGVLAALLIFPVAGFARDTGYHLLYPQPLQKQTPRAEERILALLTSPGEEIHVCETPMYCEEIMDLELVPQDACGAISYPYFYEMWGDRQMAAIQEHPHVLLYNPDEVYWGYVFREYAPDFDAYVRENYTRLAVGEDVWVSQEFLPEALERLSAAGYGDETFWLQPWLDFPMLREFQVHDTVTRRFTAEGETLSAILLRAACYYGRRQPLLSLRVVDAETGEIKGEAAMTADLIADNFFSRCPLRASLTPGREYELQLTVEEIIGRGNLGLYFTDEGQLALGLEYLH